MAQNIDGKTMNLTEENLNKLKDLFPEVFSEDKIDFEKLQVLLGENIDKDTEKYACTWKGKFGAMKIAQLQSTGTLIPCIDQSKDWDTTQNLYIEGDNLEVLKLLQKSYLNSIKMIYIDPPYNTGNDFVYEDSFADNIKNYKTITGQVAKSNAETQGRYHTNWLNMMYPRLKLARNLLKDDGIIFISIDDNEQANLKKLCDEIFGENNFVADLIWANKEGGGSSDSKLFRIKHEHVLVYSRNYVLVEILGVTVSNEERYTSSDEFESTRGKYYLQKLGMGSIQYSTSLDYAIEAPDATVVFPKDNNSGKKACWRWSKQKFEWGVKNGYIVIKKDNSNIWTVYTKQYLNADNEGNVIERTQRPLGIIENYSSTQGAKFLYSINLGEYFNYSKPLELIKEIISFTKFNENDIVLDFFSGSSTTAHAVMQLNAEDGGSRKFIIVQLPELTSEDSEAYKAGYKNICEIGKERIRRAGEKIKNGNPLTTQDLDIGFKDFKLDTSNVKKWNNSPTEDIDEISARIQDNLFYLTDDRTDIDLVYEIMLKFGLSLTLPVTQKQFGDAETYIIEDNNYKVLICLTQNIKLEEVEKMADGDVGTYIFADRCFSDANILINTEELLKKKDKQMRLF